MPVGNLHQWDTQLENIVLPLLSDIILLHIQDYPNNKNSGYFYGIAGILESKKKTAHFHAYLGPLSGISSTFRPETIISVSRFIHMTFLSRRFPPNCFALEFLTFEDMHLGKTKPPTMELFAFKCP